jgi:4-amino-4-deoxy-L-arabinose transferase
MKSSDSLRHWFVGIVLALVCALAFQGTRGLYSPDEGRYTDVALAMLDSGDWVHPMLHHEVPHWSKPPLTYWAIATSLRVFGRNEFAARLPSALAFALTVLLAVPLGRRFVPRQPWLPALVYASFAFPPLAANLVTTDTLLALWETLGVLAFAQLWWAADDRTAARARLLLGIALGLAFLTKGPPGLLPFAACVAFAVWSEGWPGLRRCAGWSTLATFLLVGGSWYALVVIQEHDVLRYFLVEEVVNRVASDKMHRNAEWYGAFKVYLPTLVLGTLPWLPFLLRAAWRHRRDALAQVHASAELRLLACWLLLPLAVFMLSRSRLPLYVLPLFMPLAMLAARQLAPFALQPWWKPALLGAWCVALVALRTVPFDNKSDDRELARAIAQRLAHAPEEVAFVDDAPRFGLRFYLGSEIERLELPGEQAAAQTQSLDSELDEHEGCRLLLIATDRRAALAAALTQLGTQWIDVDLGHYAGFAQRSHDCDWQSPKPPITKLATR